MEEKKPFKIVSAKKSRYILPSALTLIGVCLGISSIKFSLDQNYSLAVILLLFAALLDGLDGRVARLIDGTSEFGKELDSLTDFVSFGIAPAFILYFWELNNYGKIGWAITLMFSVCCVLRLARFNLTKIEKEEQWKANFFEGVPSPAGAGLVLLPLIFELSDFQIGFQVKSLTPYLAVFVSILLISKIPTYSFKKIVVPRSTTIFLSFVVVLYFGLLLIYTFNTLIISGILYFIMIPISSAHFLFIKKNKKIIEENIDHHEDVL